MSKRRVMLHLLIKGRRLALLVEGHDDHGSAVPLHDLRVVPARAQRGCSRAGGGTRGCAGCCDEQSRGNTCSQHVSRQGARDTTHV